MVMDRSTTWRPPGLGWSRRAVTSTATVTSADRGVIIDSTNNTFAGNLPAAATAGSGFLVGFYVSGSGVFTITANGAETIQTTAGSANTLALTTGMGVVLQCTGTAWESIAGAGNSANGMFLTAGRIPYAAVQGRLVDSANLSFGDGPLSGSSTEYGIYANLISSGARNTTRTIEADLTINAVTGAGDAGTAIWGNAKSGGSVSFNHIVGVQAYADHAGSGTITSVYGLNTYLFNSGGGTITNLYGLNITPPVTMTGVTNAYGIYIGDMTASQHVLYTGTGIARFGGSLTTASTATFAGVTTVTNATVPTNNTTGALVVTGGVGIAGKAFLGNELRMSGTSPQHWFVETDATADNGKWFFSIAGDVMKLRIINDAETVAADIFSFTRSGSTVGTITIGGATTQATNWAQTGATTFSTGTGAFTHNGAVTIVSGKTLTVSDTTAATSTTTGALTVAGGVGIAGKLFVGSDLRISTTAPQHWFVETDATADNGKWVWLINSEVLKLRVLNDAESVAADIFSITRSGATVGTISVGTATAASIVSVLGTAASTTTGTGALVVGAGGLGVGGNITFNGNTGASLRIVNATANAAVATVMSSVGPTGAQTTIQGWVRISVAGTDRYIPFW